MSMQLLSKINVMAVYLINLAPVLWYKRAYTTPRISDIKKGGEGLETEIICTGATLCFEFLPLAHTSY